MQDYSFGLWLSIPLAAIGWLIEVVLIRRVYKRELPEQLLLVKTSVPLPVCLMVSMVTAGLFALVIGYFCVRLTGIYFAILTMAFGQLLCYIIYMLINFVVAGMFAGLAGGLLGPFNRSIAPDLCNWHQSGLPVFMTVIGGPPGFFGPMIGSVIYTFLFACVTGFTENWPLTIGLVIVFVVLFVPGGVLGLTILFSEQNVKFATRTSDRAYVIDRGRIQYQGSIEELSANEEIKQKYLMI